MGSRSSSRSVSRGLLDLREQPRAERPQTGGRDVENSEQPGSIVSCESDERMLVLDRPLELEREWRGAIETVRELLDGPGPEALPCEHHLELSHERHSIGAEGRPCIRAPH